MSAMRLQPNKEEAFEFVIRSFELNERNFRDVLRSCTYSAASLKKRITSMPSNAGLQYARLYHAYNQQISDVRSLKTCLSVARRTSWKQIVPVMRKLLTGLPLSSNNLPLLATKLEELYPAPEGRSRPPVHAAGVREEIRAFGNESHMQLQELHTGLESCRSKAPLSEARPEALELEGVLSRIQATKREIVTTFELECRRTMIGDAPQDTK